MDYVVKSGKPQAQHSGCMVAGVFENRRLSPPAKELDEASGGYLSALLRNGDMEGSAGKTLMLHKVPDIAADRVLLVGLGPEKSFGDRAYRQAIQTMFNALSASGAKDAWCTLSQLQIKGRDLDWACRDATILVENLLYRFQACKSKKDDKAPKLRKLVLAVAERSQVAGAAQAVEAGAAVGRGMNLAKELGDLPGNICTPSYLAEQALTLGDRFNRLDVEILDEDGMEELGMGSLLSVGRGSKEESRFIIMQYRGANADDAPHVLVGKGITFDTGGISIKPGAGMDEMKYDMCGAASVLGTMQTVAELALPINVVGLVASAENMPSANATKPGDIVTSMSGQTIEVLNTDAEGRLVLCDALTYAERFKPASVVDIATLTGACIIALGHHMHGLMGNAPGLVNALLAAGRNAGDPAWELPLGEEYDELLKSNFADMANIGGRAAGSITAGCFLARYTQKYKWAHLDIAGTAWKTGDQKGATGRPVPLLTHYLFDMAAKAAR
ncbi:MAG: leucyl aminopeptidase [Aquisalimonadaceae bacterium]